MDVLANILSLTRTGNSVLSHADLAPPWGLEIGSTVRTAVHVVQRGTCWLRVGRAKPIRLHAGDVVLVPRGTRHELSDAPRTPTEPYERALARMAGRAAPARGRGETTALLCAEYTFETRGPHPMLDALPEVICLPSSVGDDDELAALLKLLMRELSGQRLGSEHVVPRLIDTMLVYIVRRWLETQPKNAGWLGALRDEQVGRALALIHDEPRSRWTVAGLAGRVGQSRAVFARRFVALVGQSPLAYVARWRMTLAAERLRSTDDTAEAIAFAVGYESPTAFGSAFRRQFQLSPGRYRSQCRRADHNAPG
jgi:AraC-like DNA-binding protein